MLFTALFTSSYWNLKPCSRVRLGRTRCPSSTMDAPSPSRACHAGMPPESLVGTLPKLASELLLGPDSAVL